MKIKHEGQINLPYFDFTVYGFVLYGSLDGIRTNAAYASRDLKSNRPTLIKALILDSVRWHD